MSIRILISAILLCNMGFAVAQDTIKVKNAHLVLQSSVDKSTVGVSVPQVVGAVETTVLTLTKSYPNTCTQNIGEAPVVVEKTVLYPRVNMKVTRVSESTVKVEWKSRHLRSMKRMDSGECSVEAPEWDITSSTLSLDLSNTQYKTQYNDWVLYITNNLPGIGAGSAEY